MKISSACIYGVSRGSSAESGTGKYHRAVKHLLLQDVAWHFIFAASLGAFVDLNVNGGAIFVAYGILTMINFLHSKSNHSVIVTVNPGAPRYFAGFSANLKAVAKAPLQKGLH